MTRHGFRAAFAFMGLAVLGLAPARAQETEGPGRWAGAIERARRAAIAVVEKKQSPGLGVAVAVHGGLVWNEGFGTARHAPRVAVTERTRFGLGSISKTLTMAAAMVLVDEELLDLDAPIERYLPDYPLEARGVTIRRIAAHQSGISDAFATEHYRTRDHFPTLESAYLHIKKGELEFDPGSKTSYATGTYTIIGRAMERVAGKSFVEIVHDKVLKPTGMTATVPNDRTKTIDDTSDFFVSREDGSFAPGPFFDPSFKLPGAGYLSTPGDLARLGVALLEGPTLSESSREEMFRAVPLADGTETEFALGLRRSLDGDRVILHQPGGGIGISCWLFLYPEERLVIAIMSNVATGPVGGQVYTEIEAAFLEAMGCLL